MAFERLRANLLRTVAQSLLQISRWMQTSAEQENAPASQEREPQASSDAPAHWLADIDRLKQNPDALSMTQYVADLEDRPDGESSERAQEPSAATADSEPAHPVSKAASIDLLTPTTEGNRPSVPDIQREEVHPTPNDFASDEPPTGREPMPLLISMDKVSVNKAASKSTPAAEKRSPTLQASNTPKVASPENPEKETLSPTQDAQSLFLKTSVPVAEDAVAFEQYDGSSPQHGQQGVQLQKTELATVQDSTIEVAVAAPIESDVIPEAVGVQQITQPSMPAPMRLPKMVEPLVQASQAPSQLETNEPGMEARAVENAPAPQQDFQTHPLAEKWPSLPDEAEEHDSLTRFEQRAGVEAARAERITERLRNRRRRLDLEQRGKFWNESLF